MENQYIKINEIVKNTMSCNAHAFDHVMRVRHLCIFLAKGITSVDNDVLKAAALLHDIARIDEMKDTSGTVDHAVLGAERSQNILQEIGFPEEKIPGVKHCILSHRFKSHHLPKTIEAKILFDADKIDVLGSIGIARAFMVAGQFGQRIYSAVDLAEYAENNMLKKRIKDLSRHSPNIEFEMKFKKIPERLYTDRAKRLAKDRLDFMGQFFKRLEGEVAGVF